MLLHLIPFPAASSPVASVTVALRRRCGRLALDWRVAGAGALRLPEKTAPERADGLWRTTCFELFLRPGAGEAYVEFNFSPSTQWAAYRFDGYRRGMANADIAGPDILAATSGRSFGLSASINLGPFDATPSARLGLTAVLETKDGAKSYWALAHKGDKPDFHRADGFIARLPLESGA
jgi:hypothetical protein